MCHSDSPSPCTWSRRRGMVHGASSRWWLRRPAGEPRHGRLVRGSGVACQPSAAAFAGTLDRSAGRRLPDARDLCRRRRAGDRPGLTPQHPTGARASACLVDDSLRRRRIGCRPESPRCATGRPARQGHECSREGLRLAGASSGMPGSGDSCAMLEPYRHRRAIRVHELVATLPALHAGEVEFDSRPSDQDRASCERSRVFMPPMERAMASPYKMSTSTGQRRDRPDHREARVAERYAGRQPSATSTSPRGSVASGLRFASTALAGGMSQRGRCARGERARIGLRPGRELVSGHASFRRPQVSPELVEIIVARARVCIAVRSRSVPCQSR